MAEDMMMKLAGETARRNNERVFREERQRKAARLECEATRAREQLAEDDVLRRVAKRLNAGTLR